MALAQTLADAPVTLESPAATSSEEERRIRAKLAAALISQGSSAEPVRHWTQGLARVAQALSGNVQLDQLSKEAAAENAAINNAYFGGSAPAASAPAGAPAGAPPSSMQPRLGPRPKMAAVLAQEEPWLGSNAGSAGSAPAETPGFISSAHQQFEPTTSPGGLPAFKPAQMASVGQPSAAIGTPALSGATPAGAIPVQTQTITPPAPQVAQAMPPAGAPGGQPIVTPSPARSKVDIPPEISQRINALRAVNSPKAQQMARDLYNQWAKPKETVFDRLDDNTIYNKATGEIKEVGPDYRSLTTPEQKAEFGIQPGDERLFQAKGSKLIHPPPETRVNVNNVAEPILEGIGKDFITQRTKAQTAINQTIPSIHEARKALDEGAITGLFADGRLNLAKGAALFGIDPSKAVNTETFGSALGQQILAHAKELGINPSNRDVVVIEGIIGGKGLEEGSLRNILDMQEKWSRQSIKNFNTMGKQLIEGDPTKYRTVAPMMKMEEPQEYKYQTRSIGGKSYYKKGGQWYEGTSP